MTIVCVCGHGAGVHATGAVNVGCQACALSGNPPCRVFTVDSSAPAKQADKKRQRLLECREHRAVYIQYAKHRIEDEDWHGVADAACDLRELDVEIRMLEDDL